ncbi:hypothetical protein [Armatimonas rosea]|uniref:Uncharacterized protein n=1 Tax=Armatimonas rosea TaxID=685828 RepID=A0A7W9W8R6_ARMRO|nr:hypothetical protein [Armatimonas rosea]MBB6052516.1 hypothetical protein [Armatimonas rosea]
MNNLNDRFLTFLDDEKHVPDRRPVWGMLAIVGGLLTLLLGVATALLWRRLFAAPLFPLGIWLGCWGCWQLLTRQRDRWLARRVREIAETGQRVNGYLVRASDSLYRPGSQAQPCQVLISFQNEVASDAEYMQYLAQRWAEKTPSRERRRRYRRVKLPHSLTDGSTVYCCDLFVHPGLLASGYLTSSVLPCLAEPGDQGGLELVPYWLLFPYVEVPQGQRQRL